MQYQVFKSLNLYIKKYAHPRRQARSVRIEQNRTLLPYLRI